MISRPGKICALVYLGLFFLAGLGGICQVVMRTGSSEMFGLPAALLAAPWSFMLMPIERSLGIVSWYEKFSGMPLLYGTFAILALLPAALINAVIFYWLGRTIFDTGRRPAGRH